MKLQSMQVDQVLCRCGPAASSRTRSSGRKAFHREYSSSDDLDGYWYR